MPRPTVEEDPDIDDEFANPPKFDDDDERTSSGPSPMSSETAGSDPRMNPRMLARTPTSHNASKVMGPVPGVDARKQRLRKRVKAPRQDKDQLNGRVPIYLIYAVRDWCDKQGITEIGEGMTHLIEFALNSEDADVTSTAYADRCVETGFYSDHGTAKERYASGEAQ